MPRPALVLDASQLPSIVDICLDRGEFCFDVETRGNVDDWWHAVGPMIDAEVEQHLAGLKRQGPEAEERVRESVRADWRKAIALNPLRNEVTWLGIATFGHSWVIPMDHRQGEELTPRKVEKRTRFEVYGPNDDRAYTKITRKPSKEMVEVVVPATFGPPPRQLGRDVVLAALEPLFFDPNVVKVNQNVKFDIQSLAKYYGGRLMPGPIRSLEVAMHILDENMPNYRLPAIIARVFDAHPYGDNDEEKLGAIIDTVAFSAAVKYVARDVRWPWITWQALRRRLRKNNRLWKVMLKESLVTEVLCDAEYEGVPIDEAALRQLGMALDVDIDDVERNLYVLRGRRWNIASTPERRSFLFDKKSEGGLGFRPLAYTEKTKQAQIDKFTLEKLLDRFPDHPALLDLQTWSELTKTRGTYVEGILPLLHEGRAHTRLHQHRTVTGRFSSSDPNLQNIPRVDEGDDEALGTMIRRMFIAPPGWQLIVADYEQIEMRITGAFSQCPPLLDIFRRGLDIHAASAARILRIPLEDVTKQQRQMGKTLGFAVNYGAGPGKIASSAHVGIDEARSFLNGFWKMFPEVAEWKADVIRTARKQGYVETLWGRRRRLHKWLYTQPANNSEEAIEAAKASRARAERQAVNAVVQGTAADICKEAMIETWYAFQGTPAKLVLQVHDELISMAPDSFAEEAAELQKQAMLKRRELRGVPLRVSCGIADNWGDAK